MSEAQQAQMKAPAKSDFTHATLGLVRHPTMEARIDKPCEPFLDRPSEAIGSDLDIKCMGMLDWSVGEGLTAVRK